MSFVTSQADTFWDFPPRSVVVSCNFWGEFKNWFHDSPEYLINHFNEQYTIQQKAFFSISSRMQFHHLVSILHLIDAFDLTIENPLMVIFPFAIILGC